MVDENTVQSEVTQEPPAPAPETPLVKAAPIESRFLFVDVAALRAKQLRRGARPRLEELAEGTEATADLPRKPERVAMEEVRRNLVLYELPDPNAEGENQ